MVNNTNFRNVILAPKDALEFRQAGFHFYTRTDGLDVYAIDDTSRDTIDAWVNFAKERCLKVAHSRRVYTHIYHVRTRTIPTPYTIARSREIASVLPADACFATAIIVENQAIVSFIRALTSQNKGINHLKNDFFTNMQDAVSWLNTECTEEKFAQMTHL